MVCFLGLDPGEVRFDRRCVGKHRCGRAGEQLEVREPPVAYRPAFVEEGVGAVAPLQPGFERRLLEQGSPQPPVAPLYGIYLSLGPAGLRGGRVRQRHHKVEPTGVRG